MSEESPEEQITNKVMSSFSFDIEQMLKRDDNIRELITSNPNLQNTAVGIHTLTKLMVGQLSQKYLKGNFICSLYFTII